MATDNDPPASTEGTRTRRRRSTVSSVAHSVQAAATDLLQRDPPPGFFAATAEALAHAPTIQQIRRGSYGADGWQAQARPAETRARVSRDSTRRRSRRHSAGRAEGLIPIADGQHDDTLEPFPVLEEETSRDDALRMPERDTKESQHPYHLGKTQHSAEAIEDEEPPASPTAATLQSTSHEHPTERAQTIPSRTRDHRVYSSGYIPPPTIPWTTSTLIALRAFLKWFFTPFGFLVTVYGLNVVAWGGMLFLLLCNASPAMCWAPIHVPATEVHLPPAAALGLSSKYPRYYNCNDINSPRRIWIEIDSQILNALFCVTGFGLIPWRFRDAYYLLRWRCTSARRAGLEKKLYGLRKLAGLYKGWVRLPGSQTLDQLPTASYLATLPVLHDSHPRPSAEKDLELQPSPTPSPSDASFDPRTPLPTPLPPPLTGVRAPPTKTWKLDFFVYAQVANTAFQACLAGFMWGMTRYNRPSWATGLFIALAFGVAAAGGLVAWWEGSRVKRVEGVMPKDLAEGEGEGEGREGVDVETK